MRKFFERWRFTAEMVTFYLTFVAAYWIGGALKPPAVKETVVKSIAFHEIYLTKDEYTQRDLQEHEQRMAELQEERRKSRVERRLLFEAEMDFDTRYFSDHGKELEKIMEEEVEKEVEKRVAIRVQKTGQ